MSNLVLYDKARIAIEKAATVDEAKDIRDKAEALRAYARQKNDKAFRKWAFEIKTRAERKIGEIIVEMREKGELPSKTGKGRSLKHPKLGCLGITHKDSAYCTALASLSPKDVEDAVSADNNEEMVKDLVAVKVKKIKRQEKQAAKLAGITKDNANRLADEKIYTVLYADCPWRYDFEETDNRKIENQYPTMDISDLKNFKVEFENGKKKLVGDIAAKESVLFFWATAPKLREALMVIDAWGFEYKTHAIWDKEHIGMGYWFRGQHELLLVATKGKMPPPEDGLRVASIIRMPRGGHSAKPKEIYEIIEKMYPKAPRVELFARDARDGWDSTGNQIRKGNQL